MWRLSLNDITGWSAILLRNLLRAICLDLRNSGLKRSKCLLKLFFSGRGWKVKRTITTIKMLLIISTIRFVHKVRFYYHIWSIHWATRTLWGVISFVIFFETDGSVHSCSFPVSDKPLTHPSLGLGLTLTLTLACELALLIYLNEDKLQAVNSLGGNGKKRLHSSNLLCFDSTASQNMMQWFDWSRCYDVWCISEVQLTLKNSHDKEDSGKLIVMKFLFTIITGFSEKLGL